MKLLIKKFNIVFDHIINFLAYVAGGLVVFMVLSIFMEVTLRKLVNISQPWVVEIGQHSVLYIAFLGAAWLLKAEGHVKMDLVVTRLKPRHQAFLNMVMSIVGALVCLVIAWFGAIAAWDLYKRGIYYPLTLEIPMAPLVAVIPPGSFLLFIQFLRRAYGYLLSWRGIEPTEAKVTEVARLEL